MAATLTLKDDQLLSVGQLKGKGRPLGDFLKGGQAKSFERKDLDPKWDSVF
jgi:hypothetical protein